MATILIVDDRPLNREFLVTLLGYDNHHLLQAADGAEALIWFCRKFCSGGHERGSSPVCVGIKQRGRRTFRPQ